MWRCSPCSTLSSAESSGKSVTCWKVRAMPWRARSWLEKSVTSRPPSSTWPRVGGNAPATMLNSVLLPAPLGPTRPTSSPSPTVKVTWSSAVSPPNCLVMPCTSRTAVIRYPSSLDGGDRRLGEAQPARRPRLAHARQLDQPAGQRQDHHQQHQRVDQALVVAGGEELLAQRGEQHRAGQRPPEAPQPANHVEDHEVGGEEEREHERAHEAQVVAMDRSHEAAEEARGHEGQRLVAGGGDAHALGESFGVTGAERQEGEAEARGGQAVEEQQRHHRGSEHDVVEAEVAVQPNAPD